MTMVERASTAHVVNFDVRDVEAAVEGTMAEHLCWHREQLVAEGVDPDAAAMVLDCFEDWAGEYGLPTSAHVLAAYLIELRACGADMAEVRAIGNAYLFLHAFDVRVPVLAAISYCESAPACFSTHATALH
jgi:hypothetical protein